MTTLHTRKTHGGCRTEYFDPATDEILARYAPGDGSLRFVWCNGERNDTGRPVTMEEAAQMPCDGFRLVADSSGRPQMLPGSNLAEHRALLD